MVEELQQQILELAQDTKKTVQDYIDSTYNGYLTVSGPLENTAGMFLQVVGFGCISFCAVYVVRAFHLLDKRERKNSGRGGI